MTGPARHRWALWLVVATPCAPAFGQNPPALVQSTAKPPTSFGVEIAFRSGHAYNGFIISDRAVVQPVVWVSGDGAEFSVWGNLPLAATSDGARPQILELEASREHKWGHLTIAPAMRMYFYRDPVNIDADRSIEGWLYLKYRVGPLRLFTNHSLDVLTYRGAYYGEAGISSEQHVTPQLEVGGSVGAGWASAKFNATYAGVATSVLDRVMVEGWFTAHLTPHTYISPHVEFSSIVNRAVRAELTHPTYVLVRLATGVEF